MHTRPITHIACIGTGIMGAPIAEHLLNAGYHVTVYNRTKSKAADLIKAGAIWKDSVEAAVAAADFVLTMLSLPSDVEDVYLSRTGILRAARPGTWMCDCTTSSPELAADIARAAAQNDCFAFDCPVTGGEEGAREGNLTLLIGAQEKEIMPALDVLKQFSSKRYFFGAAGKGQAAKLCNQVSLASCMVGYCDALALARESGLDTSYVFDMIAHGMGDSRALDMLAPKSIVGDYKPGFKALHLRKDLKLALDCARELELELPGADTAYNLYDLLCDIGGEALGTQALSLLYEGEAAGVAAGLDWSNYESQDQLDDAAADAESAHVGAGAAHISKDASTPSTPSATPAAPISHVSPVSSPDSESAPLSGLSLETMRTKNLADSWIHNPQDNA